MAWNRTLSQIATGEYTATVMWIERCAGVQIPRCAELAPLKVAEKTATLYLDNDGEKTLEFQRGTNKNVQVYIAMSLFQVVEERVKNRVKNSTRCCYGRTDWSGRGVCKTHTRKWLQGKVEREVKVVRAQHIPEPDRIALERDALARRNAREESQVAGNGEWCRVPRCGGWYVRIADRKQGEIVNVRTRSGGMSKVRLVRKIADGIWESGAA